VGSLLVDRAVITPEQHRAVITEVIRRLKQLGPDAYGSTVERRGLQAERRVFGHGGSSSVAFGPPPSGTGSGGGPLGRPNTPAEPLTPARGWSGPWPGEG